MISLALLKRRSQRITTTIPHAVHLRVLELSDEQGRSASNFCAYLIERALATLYPTSVNLS